MSSPGPRKEVESGADSPRHPPHVDANARGAPLQNSTPTAGDVPTSPANASGHDLTPDTRQAPIDRESMYDRRPEEDKHYDSGDA